jgi:hypothetical protein
MDRRRFISKLRNLRAAWILPGMDDLDMMDWVCVGAGKVHSLPEASQPPFSDCLKNLMFGKHNILGFTEVRIQTLSFG